METNVKTKTVRLVDGRKGGFVNRLNRRVTPYDLVETDEETAALLIKLGDFEAASTPRPRPVEPAVKKGNHPPAPARVAAGFEAKPAAENGKVRE